MLQSDPARSAADATFYSVRLGAGAAARGERVLCQWLKWAGADDNFAQVRIVHSTLPPYAVGQVGLVKSERLAPVRVRQHA